jgi:hypothetical protein
MRECCSTLTENPGQAMAASKSRNRALVLGSRGSALALAQAGLVREWLELKSIYLTSRPPNQRSRGFPASAAGTPSDSPSVQTPPSLSRLGYSTEASVAGLSPLCQHP